MRRRRSSRHVVPPIQHVPSSSKCTLETVRQLTLSDTNEHLIEDDVVRDLYALELVETFGETTRDLTAALDEVGDAGAPE